MMNQDEQPRTVDLGVAWSWKYDGPFIAEIRKACERGGITLLGITEQNVNEVTRDVLDGSLHLRWLFDRASDEHDAFRSLASTVLKDHRSGRDGRTMFINPPDDARRAADKATMHLEFISHGIHVPHTIILSSYATQPEVDVPPDEMAQLGTPFVIKPANTTGGGTGVMMGARTIQDIHRHRMTFEKDKYLLQRKISPVYLGKTRAWFRVFYAFGETFLCWWDDQTHVYETVSVVEEQRFGFQELRNAIRTIAGICRLDFFSSEFAQISDTTYVSVDYVNELCDMRPKSMTPDGVPDELVKWVAERMVLQLAKEHEFGMSKV